MMTSDFLPPRWLRSADLQTLGASLPLHIRVPSAARVEECLRWPLPVSGGLHARAFWATRDGRVARRPAVILVHGVGGSFDSQYMVRAALSLHRRGYHAVRLNVRGAGDSIADAPELYHAGLVEDLEIAVEQLAKRAEVSSVAVLGFSLGGNVTLKLAGLRRKRTGDPLKAFVAISAPLDLAVTSRNLESWRTLPYRVYVLANLITQARAWARLHPERINYSLDELYRLRTVRGYDDLVVAPMHGFGTSERYYAATSSGPSLRQIEVPTLLVHAEDDPMVPGWTVRPWLDSRTRAVEVAWSERGGHVGFFTGMSEDQWLDTWAMARTADFLEQHLGKLAQG
jgi:predicted alpha/beta-fold hydrolase